MNFLAGLFGAIGAALAAGLRAVVSTLFLGSWLVFGSDPGPWTEPPRTGSPAKLIAVATPVLNPAAGTKFKDSLSVSITTATAGAQIRYTTDGWDPSEASPLYSGPVIFNWSTTVKARAFKSGMAPSAVASASYDPVQKIAAPLLNPTPGIFTGSVIVNLVTPTSGATIRCTTDGTAPTNSSLVCGRFTLTTTATLRARAFKTGMGASDLAAGTYTVLQKVATPTFSPRSGMYTQSVSVNIRTSTIGAIVRCTTNNTDPTESSPICLYPEFRRTTNLRARAFMRGMVASDVVSGTYTVPQVAAPSFSPGSSRLYGGSLSVKITSATSGAIIRYTINGGDPTTASPIYRGPIAIAWTATISARAYKNGLADSDVTRATYINVVYSQSPRAGVFFDDFKYSSTQGSDTRFTERWHVADACGDGPGLGSAFCPVGSDGTTREARYRAGLVTIVPNEPSGLLQIKAVTSGTPESTMHSLVSTVERQPLQGTFAAKLWFDNPKGQRDVNVQGFLMAYGIDSRINPSELDFEYLANLDANWLAMARQYSADAVPCRAGLPCLLMTSWQPNTTTTARTVSSARVSLLGWNYLVIQIDSHRRQIRYTLYDSSLNPVSAQATHFDPFFPAEEMFLMFNHWLSWIDVVPQQQVGGSSREYKMWVDWVYRDPDASLTAQDVVRKVTALQQAGCDRFPDPDPFVRQCH